VYELFSRSRWYVFGFMLASVVGVVLFMTAGPGAMLTERTPSPGASNDAAARQNQFQAWAEDDVDEETGAEAARPAAVRDPDMQGDVPAREDADSNKTVPFSGKDTAGQDSGSDE